MLRYNQLIAKKFMQKLDSVSLGCALLHKMYKTPSYPQLQGCTSHWEQLAYTLLVSGGVLAFHFGQQFSWGSSAMLMILVILQTDCFVPFGEKSEERARTKQNLTLFNSPGTMRKHCKGLMWKSLLRAPVVRLCWHSKQLFVVSFCWGL